MILHYRGPYRIVASGTDPHGRSYPHGRELPLVLPWSLFVGFASSGISLRSAATGLELFNCFRLSSGNCGTLDLPSARVRPHVPGGTGPGPLAIFAVVMRSPGVR